MTDESIQAGAGSAGESRSSVLSRALGGSLPCAFCGYQLKGLSIEGRCPECGTLIRATILYTVDPEADELKPVTHRHVVSIALVVWALGAVVGVLAAWAPRVADTFWQLSPGGARPIPEWAPHVQLIGIVVSAVGMVGLIRPVRSAPIRESVLALVSLGLYLPLYLAQAAVLSRTGSALAVPYLVDDPSPARIRLRLVSTACIIGILLAFRPTARRLVRRSLALRTGRVDRQTILAMVGALVIVMVGDSLRLVTASSNPGPTDPATLIGSIAVFLGSGLFTLGLVGAVIDCWRISGAILIPSPSLRDVLGDGEGA